LHAVGAKNIDNLQLLISFVKTKINTENKITDDETLTDIKKLIETFSITLNEIPESVH
jgi:chromate reductase